MDLVRKIPAGEKLRRTLELSHTVRMAGEAGLRQAYPHASDREIFLRVARQNLGSELFRRVYGEEIPGEPGALAIDGSAQRNARGDHSGA